MSAEKIQLFHEEMMQEEGLKMSDLPIEIQKKIKGFNLMKGAYEKNPQERELINLRKKALKLGDEIQNFIEKDYDDSDSDDDDKDKDDDDSTSKSSKGDEDKKDEKKSSTPKPSKENNTEKRGENPSKEKPVSTGGKFGNLMMEKKILAIMESKGEKRIKISDLESIIGREPEYPEQIVNNIKLRKVFLSSDYRLV
jgi:hypothetical protein